MIEFEKKFQFVSRIVIKNPLMRTDYENGIIYLFAPEFVKKFIVLPNKNIMSMDNTFRLSFYHNENDKPKILTICFKFDAEGVYEVQPSIKGYFGIRLEEKRSDQYKEIIPAKYMGSNIKLLAEDFMFVC